jgi:hypothetical protein
MLIWTDYEAGEHRINCPACDGRKTLGITIEHGGKGIAHCFRCSFVESSRHGTERSAPVIKAKPAAQKHTVLSDWGRKLWAECIPLSGVALDYLKARRCYAPPYGDLKWHPTLKHPSGYIGAALVGLVTDVHTNEPLSLHRTWITATGKADVDPPRLLLANHSTVGGCIRLTPDDEANALLGIAEGLETALSLAWAPLPVWAMIDANHLSQFPVLAGIQTLVIAQDQDAAGIAAATTCATRWAAADKEVLVTQQDQNDLNDSLMEAIQNER